MIEFAYFFRKLISIMLNLKLHGGSVEDSENAEEFFLDPSTLEEGGSVVRSQGALSQRHSVILLQRLLLS